MKLVFKGVSPWLRYVLWFAALIFAILTFKTTTHSPIEYSKLIISLIGVLLFSVSGFLLVCRHYLFDLTTKSVTITQKRWNKKSVAVFFFSDIQSINPVFTQSNNEDTNGRTRTNNEWAVSLLIKNVTHTLPSLTFDQFDEAQKYTEALIELLQLSNKKSDPLDLLIGLGKTIEAIAFVRNSSGASLKEAKEIVDRRKIEIKKT